MHALLLSELGCRPTGSLPDLWCERNDRGLPVKTNQRVPMWAFARLHVANLAGRVVFMLSPVL